MGRIGRSVVVGLLVLAAACSGGGSGGASGTTTTSSSATTTSQPTTSTTTPEDAVREAYLAYWKMIDRLAAAPDPNDPELAARAIDPVFSIVRDDMATRKSEGRSTRPPENSKYVHQIQAITVDNRGATVRDCYVDDRVQFGPDGSVLNDHVSTVTATAALSLVSGEWKVSDVQIQKLGDGELQCHA